MIQCFPVSNIKKLSTYRYLFMWGSNCADIIYNPIFQNIMWISFIFFSTLVSLLCFRAYFLVPFYCWFIMMGPQTVTIIYTTPRAKWERICILQNLMQCHKNKNNHPKYLLEWIFLSKIHQILSNDNVVVMFLPL